MADELNLRGGVAHSRRNSAITISARPHARGRVFTSAGRGSTTRPAWWCVLIFLIALSTAHARLIHRFSFSETNGSTVAIDSVSGSNGVVLGARLFTNGVLTLPGQDSDFVDLPNGLLSRLTNISVELWFTWYGASSRGYVWQRIFDLGGSTSGEGMGGPTAAGFFCLIPRDGNVAQNLAFIVGIAAHQPTYLSAPGLVEGTEYHITVTYSPERNVSKLFVDGQLMSSGTASIPLREIVDFNNWIGRSNWGDPAINGAYREFRIYDEELNEAQVAANFAAGPEQLAAPVTLQPVQNNLGPSSRRTGLVISEIMFAPAPRADGRDVQFVEIQNTQPMYEDLGGFRLTGDADFTFPNGTILRGNSYLVVARNPADVRAVYGITNVLGGFTNDLRQSSGTIRLRNKLGAVLLEANYSSKPPWPVAANGAGHSAVLARPSYGERHPEAWAASQQPGGSPGSPETNDTSAVRSVVINEFLPRATNGQQSFIELYNRGTQTVDLTGCVLTDEPLSNKFVLSGSINAGGYAVFTEAELGFPLGPLTKTIYFKNTNGAIIDGVVFSPQERGVSFGRFPNGADALSELFATTPGTANNGIKPRDLVISEIMYHPISEDSDDEFIEIRNRGAAPVNLSGWKLDDDIEFKFPANATIPAGGYFVVAADKDRLLTNYPGINAAAVFGDFKGKLSNSRGRIALTMPETVVTTNPTNGLPETNTLHIVVDDLEYHDGGRWGQWSDGGGSSLELADVHSDNRQPSNWRDSTDTQQSQFTTIEYTGVLQDGDGLSPYNGIEVILLGPGEAMLDDVEVTRNGVNLVPNSTFDAGANGWRPEGSHDLSSWELNGGVNGSGGMHIRAVTRGDYIGNRLQAELSAVLQHGEVVTIRGKVRWLRGAPEVVLRIRGNPLEATGAMPLPKYLGTPAAPNSTSTTNLGPAIFDTIHTPLLPALNQPVVVTTRATDPDRIDSVQLRYRIDPAAAYVTVEMNDGGAAGDAIAGDGIYSATIPGQPTTNLIAFKIFATDQDGATSQFPDTPPQYLADVVGPECLVRWGEYVVDGSVGTYRFWITQASFNEWTTRTRVHNAPLNATFVYGNDRVVYNIGAKWNGSAYLSQFYTTPTGELCGYGLFFPPDDLFLGDTDIGLDWPVRDPAVQLEQIAYWMAEQLGIPNGYRRFMHLFVNGVRRGVIYEDAEQPSGDYVEKWFPNNADGDLYKMEVQWRNYQEPVIQAGYLNCTMENFVRPDGSKNQARYRWTWLKRAADGSANDFSTLYDLIDAANDSGPNYVRSMEDAADPEQLMRVWAFTHFVCNLDAYTYGAGHNMYAYKPNGRDWTMVPFDVDFAFNMGGGATTSGLFDGFGNDPRAAVMVNHPAFRRMYWRAIEDAVNGPFVAANVEPLMDEKYRALQQNGAPATASPQAAKDWIRGRRDYMISQLQTVAAPFAITSNSGNDFTTGNNLLLLTGTAPIAVKTIRINGVDYEVTWTSVNTWRVSVALAPGLSTLAVQGIDPKGNAVAGASDTIRVTFTGTPDAPENSLVINEIMYNPPTPGAEFVEILNRSTTTAFDLTGCRLNGADFNFAPGTVIAPGEFFVIAKDRRVFARVYGTAVPVRDEFNGSLDGGGETLSLVRIVGTNEFVINRVTYDDDPPWPAAADGGGSSLQVIDPIQDNRRVANWAVNTNATPNAPEWQFVSATGTASSSKLYVYLNSAGDVFVDDIQIVAGTIPEVGSNYVINGDFESQLTPPWTVSTNHAASYIDTNTFHRGAGSLHAIASSGGSTEATAIWQNTQPLTAGATCTLSYWYLPSTNGSGMTVRLSGSGIVSAHGIAPQLRDPRATPGVVNSVNAPLPPFPNLWINEVLPNNRNGLADRFGEREPWIEIFNAGTNSVSLAGLHLSDNFTNLVQWAFPSNATMAAGEFKIIFADAEENESIASELHTNFRPGTNAGLLALSRLRNGASEVLDSVPYANVLEGHSFGSFPDGIPFNRRQFYRATPGAPNDVAVPAGVVLINEWMADNASTIADPADEDYEDWFELFNPGTNAVNLEGFYLSDSITNRTQYRIPAGYVVPARGFLLVWADSESSQNRTNRIDLHVNFKLGAEGESIVLSSPEGAPIDSVSFGAQASDVSEGRYPDGTGPSYTLPLPTPRAANAPPFNNSPPVLAAIGDKIAYEGQTLAFTASATDADAAQALTFSLDPGAPASATIHPTTGAFSWTPTLAQTPSTNVVTVRVTDNGTPALDDFETFTVVVARLPRFTSTARDGTQLTLTWSTRAGRSYRVDYKDSLNEPVWTPTGPAVVANGDSMTAMFDVSVAPQRFFRVVEVE